MSESETGEALHLTLDVRPDAVDEVEAQLARHGAAPGWSALSVLRVSDAPRLHVVARWDGDARPAAADALLGEIEANAETQLASPPAVDGCAVLAAEAGDGGGGAIAPGGSGWQFHVTVEARPGHEAVYERWKIEEGERQRVTPGFRRRLLLRSHDRPHLFFYQSFWDSQEQARAFGSTPEFHALMREIDPQGAMAHPQLLEECALRLDVR